MEHLKNNEKTVEILQVSALEDYEWPEDDPHAVKQRTRCRMEQDLELVKLSLQSAKLDMKVFKKNAIKDNLSVEEQILKILSHQKFQMNPTAKVRNEKRWQDSIAYSVKRGEPIDIVYPQFCVIPNAPKRYTNSGYTAGEDCTIEFFRKINDYVKEIYKFGVRFHALADAALYASAFQTPQVEVDEYYDSLKKRIKELNAEDFFFLYDYAELLRETCQEEFTRLYYQYSRQVWAGNASELLPDTDIPTLWRSVRCSVNTRRFQLRHRDHLKIFGPLEYQDENNKYYKKLKELTDTAFNEVVAIRLACSDLDIASRNWPHAIRATCHKGEKNGHWPIGLKTYPEYYGSCKLLPYHGMPLISKNKKNKIRLEIYPEVLLRGRDDLIRVTIGKTDEVYMYILDEIEDEYYNSMGISYSTPTGMRIYEFERGE